MSKPRKPTGRIQRAVVTPRSFDVQRIEFPKTKEEVEKFIAEAYLECTKAAGIPVTHCVQNDTDDFDFNATIEGRDGYLELTEIAPLGPGGYESAGQSYDVVPFATTIADQVEKKAAKYAGVSESPIVLLLYVTDWRFSVVDQVFEHLQYLMRDGKHGFSRIDLVTPCVRGSAEVKVIYPSERNDWSGYDPKVHDATGICFADVSKPLSRDKWPDSR